MKPITIALIATLLLPSAYTVNAAEKTTPETLATKMSGRIILQVESYGRAWYVDPVKKQRYYLKDGAEALTLMRSLGLGISNTDLAKIPTTAGQPQTTLSKRLAGRIVLQVKDRGQAWYINPADGLRYYLKDGDAAYAAMKQFGIGMKNVDLAQIPVNSTQLVHDTTFSDVAYAVVRDGTLVAGEHADTILAPASMSKLMTALVLLDQPKLDWQKEVTITQAMIDYPIRMVGKDGTSEVDIRTGDRVTVRDLWVAMLVSSSNQATIALVDISGLSREQFVKAMNTKAKTLKLTHTLFFDPTGLDAHNVTTPREMAEIARAAFADPHILTAQNNSGYKITTRQTPSRTITVIDRNYSLQAYHVDASKTGFLVEARSCVALKKRR